MLQTIAQDSAMAEVGVRRACPVGLRLASQQSQQSQRRFFDNSGYDSSRFLT
jgi:hypothetical protein